MPVRQPPMPARQPPRPVRQPPMPVSQPPMPVRQPPMPVRQPPMPLRNLADPPTSAPEVFCKRLQIWLLVKLRNIFFLIENYKKYRKVRQFFIKTITTYMKKKKNSYDLCLQYGSHKQESSTSLQVVLPLFYGT